MPTTNNKLRGTDQSATDDDCILCHITESEVTFDENDSDNNDEDDANPQYACHYDSSLGFRDTLAVSLPRTTVDRYKAIIQTGTAHFCISSKYQEERTLTVPEDAELVLDDERRKLLSHKHYTIGTKRVLAVRVTSSIGEEPDETVEEIGGAIFGTDWDASSSMTLPSASVVQQYHAVSHGQLHLIPAKGNGISNGIVQVKLSMPIAGKEIQRDLTTEILSATREALGADLNEVAEHFIFCIPSDSLLNGKDTWTAFTYLFEPYSFYQKSRGTKLSVVMHEFGHSLGFRHSGYAGNEYADESGYMGYAVNKFGYPRKSFNAHKHWLSGWFSDRAAAVYPDQGPVVASLLSFVDYGNSNVQSNDIVLMRAGSLYMHYNRAKGYNSDTPNAYEDRVVITESAGDLELSNFVAALSKGQSYFYPNFSGYNSLVIEICDQMTGSYDYAVVSMYIEDGIQQSICGDTDKVLQVAPNAYPLNTTSLDGSSTDAGPLINEDATISERSRTEPVVGVVWGIVALLFLVALYLIYKIRSHQTTKAAIALSRKGKPRQTDESQRRHSWIPTTIETPSKDSERDSESDDSTRTPTSSPPSSHPSTPDRL